MTMVIRVLAALCAGLLASTLVDASPATAAAAPVATHASKADATTDVTTDSTTDAARVSCRVPRCFGSIAMSPDQAFGVAYNYGGKRAARDAAHRRCRANSGYPAQCTRMGWVRNGCMAVAIVTGGDGWIDRWAVGYGRSRQAAQRQARNRLNGGFIRAWTCTARRY